MSAPRYSSRYYDEAEKEYKKALAEYSGDAGVLKAKQAGEQMANEGATAAGESAGSAALSSARSAGLTKGQAAIAGRRAAQQTTEGSWQNLYNKVIRIKQMQINRQLLINRLYFLVLLTRISQDTKQKVQDMVLLWVLLKVVSVLLLV